MTVIMHIAPSFVAAAENIDIRLRHHHRAAAVASIHVSHTSRQDCDQRNRQPNLDPVNRTVSFVHKDLPFADEIKTCGGPCSTIRRALIANRIIFSV
jgi:hypothetical protein